jgi:hypothetical protein
MKAGLKCIHWSLLVSVGLFAMLWLVLPGVTIQDVFGISPAGPCSVPVCLLFVPMELGFLFGLGVTTIRLLSLASRMREAKDKEQ